MIATCIVAASGIPTMVQLSLMPVTRQGLPVEDGFDLHALLSLDDARVDQD